MSNLIGQVLLRRYRVDEFIAAGSMGSVYKVWDLQRSVPLAMKVLHGDVAEDAAAFSSFQREVQTLESLAHPNIVPFYGVHRGREFDFLLEGYIDGLTLKDVLRRRQGSPLPLNDVLVCMKALCAALGYAHHQRTIHCDIKPANVMFDSSGRVFLADFGIARHAGSTTTTLAGAGTPAYMAPEQVLLQPVTPATDVYALGVMLFEMLTGQRPFRGDAGGSTGSAAERIRAAHVGQPPPDPRSLNPKIPASLAAVMLRSLEKDPAQRYPTTPAFFDAVCIATGVHPENVPERLAGVVPEVIRDETRGESPKEAGGGMPLAGPTGGKKQSALVWLAVAGGLVILVLAFAMASGGNGPPETVQNPPTGEAAPAIAPGSTQPATLSPPTDAPAAASQPTALPTVPPALTLTPTTPPLDWRQGRLVFSMRAPGDTSEARGLYTLDLAQGGDPQPLYAQGDERYMGAVWSPDGSRVAFYEQFDKALLVIPAGGGNYQKMASGCNQPSWLPDGQQIICVGDGGATAIVDFGGSQRSGPVSSGALLPDWSPLGDYVLYSVGGAQIYRVLVGGGQAQLVAGQGSENYAPAWSHDGQWVAYQSNAGSDYSEVWVSCPDGSQATLLTDTKTGHFSRGPSWSPDDRWLVYVSGPGGKDWGDIYVVPVGGGEPVQITHTGGNVYDWRVHWGP